ncbi:MAG: alpha/beta fold hydrolase [Gammaproteobacteria bacterium]
MKFVLIHGAWHYGELFEQTAAPIRAAGHEVFLPTLYGNAAGDPKDVGLGDVIERAADYIEDNRLDDFVLMGHSYAGMVITGLADRMPEKIRRLVYWNAFVPLDGESLNDLVPPHYVTMFDQICGADGGVELPFEIWREAFINDGSLEEAKRTYELLVSHPYKTFKDGLPLSKNPADMAIPKSYVNCTEDTALPHSFPWHPRLSEKLGLYRLLQISGSHELCFTNPALLGECILSAGLD